jgi:hypothetical protein
MGKPGKSSRSRKARESKALCRLREATGLDPAEWQAFRWHARNGFADYERAPWAECDEPLDLQDVPEEWFQDPEALGYVVLRVLRQGKAELATPVVRFFLGICDFAPGTDILPPGIGASWLHAAKAEVLVPIDAARLAFLAAQSPKEFFQGVDETDLPVLSRMILEAKGEPEAWDLHVLLAAVDRAQIHVRAPFRLFDALMAADWLSREVKGEFCRGLLGCSPEADRLQERDTALRRLLESDEDWWGQFPLLWLEVARYGLRLMVSGLRRHAVVALVEHVGEPAPEVIAEFLLRPDKRDHNVDMVHQGALDVVEARTEELGPEATQQYLQQAIAGGAAAVRHAAYRIGLKHFGPDFARPALKDTAGSVRKWAAKALASARLQPPNEATST